jgi:hypothetical protein
MGGEWKQLHEQSNKLKQVFRIGAAGLAPAYKVSIRRSIPMAKLTRRKLITQVSVGAGTTGALAVTATYAFLKTTSNPSANAAYTPKDTNTAYTSGDPLAVFVTDPTKGTLKIMKGDREITISNPSLAQSLLSLV